MKKTVVFRSGSLRMGGLERVLIEVLQNINLDKYRVIAMIEDNSGKENIFLKDIPEGIEVYFLKPEEVVERTKYHRNRKKNIFNKIMYNYLMVKERSIALENTQKVLKNIGVVNVFIDFDWGALKYVEKLDVEKKIVWIHNSIPKLLGERRNKIKRFGENLKKYDIIVAICDDMKDEIEKIYPFLEGKVTRLYNPFNFKRIEEMAMEEKMLKKEEKEMLKEDYIVAVSRLDMVQKDYVTLIKSFKILKDRGIKQKLYIVGEGPGRTEIEKLISENNLSGEVKLIGQTKNPYVWIKHSRFFVHSSKYEGLPTVLIEAMICGKIVISSDCPTGPREILNNGKAGVLFTVGNSIELSNKIEELINNRKKQKEYEESLKEQRNKFNSIVVMKEYEKLIDEE